MTRTAVHWLGRSLLAAAAALLTGCADDAPLSPDGRAGFPEQLELPSPAVQIAAAAKGTNPGDDNRGVDLGACQNLRPPAGSKLAFRVYAKGVQIYHWTGGGWAFDGPEAVLSADAEGKSTVGTHYAGPTWESNSGGTLVGTVLQRCTPDPDAIPWLLLGTVAEGPGVFHRVTHIQRVNTVGGKEPPGPGSFVGQEMRVPYTTEYLFYRAK